MSYNAAQSTSKGWTVKDAKKLAWAQAQSGLEAIGIDPTAQQASTRPNAHGYHQESIPAYDQKYPSFQSQQQHQQVYADQYQPYTGTEPYFPWSQSQQQYQQHHSYENQDYPQQPYQDQYHQSFQPPFQPFKRPSSSWGTGLPSRSIPHITPTPIPTPMHTTVPPPQFIYSFRDQSFNSPSTEPTPTSQQSTFYSPSLKNSQPNAQNSNTWASVSTNDKSKQQWSWSTGKSTPTFLDIKINQKHVDSVVKDQKTNGSNTNAIRFSLASSGRKFHPDTPTLLGTEGESQTEETSSSLKTGISSRTFIQADSNPTTTKKSKIGLSVIPNAFKEFSLRAYGSCNTPQERTLMKQLLKRKYEEAKKSGVTMNWEAMPIPKLPSQEQSFQSSPNAFSKKKIKQHKQNHQWNPPANVRRTNTPVIGTSTELEKEYFRIKGEVDPGTVRPEHILQDAFKHSKMKFKHGEVGYKWIRSQLKAIRQDLTVQHIRNEFAAQVYETHARIALEYEDHAEFILCQSELNRLYAEGINGAREEFLAYRLLGYIFKQSDRDLNTLLCQLSKDERSMNNIQHALEVLQAYTCNNYARFIKLYESAPGMAPYLMDKLMIRLRKRAIAIFAKTYRPSIPLDQVRRILKFDSIADALKFLEELGVAKCLSQDGAYLDCHGVSSNLTSAI